MTRLSMGVELTWQIAAMEAADSGFEFIEPEHLVVGACSLEKVVSSSVKLSISESEKGELKREASQIANAVKTGGTNCTALRRALRLGLGEGDKPKERRRMSRSTLSRKAFEEAERQVQKPGESIVTALNLLTAVLKSDAPILMRTFRELNVDPARLQSLLLEEAGATAAKSPTDSALDAIGRDLTSLAAAGKLNDCIGRDPELLDLVRTLSRVTKSNPLIIGEPGVGKTCLVEALALRMAQGKLLPDHRIVQINISDLVAGTQFRGELEERLKQVLDEAQRKPNVIVFIDEIHTIIGAGGREGRSDVANVLKPALARGEFRCIGATTTEEYRKHIERDPAFERRFQVIRIEEPSSEQTCQILNSGYVSRFSDRHKVSIDAESVTAAVDLSLRYIQSRRLPDKAIDVLDEACARVAIPSLSASPGAETWNDKRVTAGDVIDVVSDWTGIPAGFMRAGMGDKSFDIYDRLTEQIVGQDTACRAVADLLQRAQAGLKSRTRPIGVVLFTGPTGVGKTELAKVMTKLLLGSSERLVRFDMSEFVDRWHASRLFGAPPGYVGYEEEGELTRALQKNPFSVVLLDEVEKAHRDVLNVFLQVFDDGRLTSGKGKTVDAKNALFILTSNATMNRHREMGFLRDEQPNPPGHDSVQTSFSPELLNRLDAVVEFRSLAGADAEKITSLLLQQMAAKLQDSGVHVTWTNQVIAHLVKVGFDDRYGARSLRRAVEQQVETPIATALVASKPQPDETIAITAQEDEIVIERALNRGAGR